MSHLKNLNNHGTAPVLILLLLLLPIFAFADSDETLSKEIIGHWVHARSHLFFYRNHKLKSTNLEQPNQNQHGTWTINKGVLQLSIGNQQWEHKITFTPTPNSMQIIDPNATPKNWSKIQTYPPPSATPPSAESNEPTDAKTLTTQKLHAQPSP
jgi:hypothetical protein